MYRPNNRTLQPKAILRESFPQHFVTLDGSGLYPAAIPANHCLTHVEFNNKSMFFNHALRKSAEKYKVPLHKVWHFYNDRGDLHRYRDCTHYCWSVFTWMPFVNSLYELVTLYS